MEGNFIITGGAMGFGEEFSRRVLEGGGRVVVADKNEEKGMETCMNFQQKFGASSCCFQYLDVTKKEDWETLWTAAEKFFAGKISVLVNNAGVSPVVGFELCMKINLDGVLLGCNLFEEKLGKHNGGPGGLVVNTASLAGLVCGFNQKNLSYQIAKHGVVAATKSFGNTKVVRKTGIKHVAICPYFAKTAILNGLPDVDKMVKALPFGMTTVERVGEAFQQIVMDQRSGSCLVVMPGCPLTYYPDMSEATPVVVFMLSKILAVLGVKTVHPNMMGPLLAFLIFLLFGVFHFILSYLGI